MRKPFVNISTTLTLFLLQIFAPTFSSAQSDFVSTPQDAVQTLDPLSQALLKIQSIQKRVPAIARYSAATAATIFGWYSVHQVNSRFRGIDDLVNENRSLNNAWSRSMGRLSSINTHFGDHQWASTSKFDAAEKVFGQRFKSGAELEELLNFGRWLRRVGRVLKYGGIVTNVVMFLAEPGTVLAATLVPTIPEKYYMDSEGNHNGGTTPIIYYNLKDKSSDELKKIYSDTMFANTVGPWLPEEYILAAYANSILESRGVNRSREKMDLDRLFKSNEENGINDILRALREDREQLADESKVN